MLICEQLELMNWCVYGAVFRSSVVPLKIVLLSDGLQPKRAAKRRV
ncbi:hypothetical protein N473_01110 [Pseudoalteromonas luteoviolacea CPMOR-1]|uniref:Uncharacterized protein n=1 Tax=Pseudoalteromonas luteoviolacea CPMOR-1 TaxID=1365248 RepID=A0A161YSP5_9GAMM|nr:hypothetical protein N473_01110 [Pseudoalteromonas luteoviolacea CPMOR-1]